MTRLFVICLLLSIILSWHFASAQIIDQDTSDPNFFLRKELSFRLMAHSGGLGTGFVKGKHISVFTKRIWENEIFYLKSPKEVKSQYPFADNSKSYVYGKMNYVFVIRSGMGIERLFNRKPYWGGIEVRYFYHGGLSLGFEKPIYLYIINYLPNTDEYTLDIEKYNPNDHFYDNIYGRAPFSNGFDELRIHPGIYGKAGFSFDYSGENDRVRRLQAGIAMDFYPQPIKIMAFNSADNLFLTFFLTLDLGKRYNRKLKEKEELQ